MMERDEALASVCVCGRTASGYEHPSPESSFEGWKLQENGAKGSIIFGREGGRGGCGTVHYSSTSYENHEVQVTFVRTTSQIEV